MKIGSRNQLAVRYFYTYKQITLLSSPISPQLLHVARSAIVSVHEALTGLGVLLHCPESAVL